MTQTKEILSLAVEICDAMLRNGAEIYRVDDTAVRILNAYDIQDYNVYVLANGVFATAHENKEDSCSMIRYVPLTSPHLGRIAALNQLARELCSYQCTIEEAWVRLEECRSIPTYPLPYCILFCGIACSGFTYLFGGGLIDMIFSFFNGMLVQFTLDYLARQKTSAPITNILTSCLLTAFALLIAVLGFPVSYDKIIIGGLMPLVPGVALTTSIRDFFNGDYLSGTIHLIDALLTSFCIAVGVGTIIGLFHSLGGVF